MGALSVHSLKVWVRIPPSQKLTKKSWQNRKLMLLCKCKQKQNKKEIAKEDKMARFEGVEVININNNEYALGDMLLEDVLEAIDVDETKVDLRQDGKTLYVVEKSGTKGLK